MHLICFDALFGRQHLIKLRCGYSVNRHQPSQEVTLLVGEFLNVSLARAAFGSGCELLPVQSQLLADWLSSQARLLEKRSSLLLLGIREIKNLCEVLQVPEHKVVRFFLGASVASGHVAGRRLRENDAGSECGDCGVSYQCMSHKSLPASPISMKSPFVILDVPFSPRLQFVPILGLSACELLRFLEHNAGDFC